VCFRGFVRICPGASGQDQQSWLCASGTAEVNLDGERHYFKPERAGLPDTYFYADGENANTCASGWTDHLCPIEIKLAEKLQDNQWHELKIIYTNTAPGGSNAHVACCGPGRWWYGATLFLGCEIEVRDTLLAPSRFATPGKFQGVNLHGVPLPERSPTGETESDQPENGFLIDVYNLAPSASFPELSIPLEGGELALELRRHGGVRTAQSSTNTTKLPITYPTDDLLGLGWGSNLSARAVITGSNACGADPPRATITDAGGTVYPYLFQPGANTFRPEVYEPQANAALRATPQLTGITLTLTLEHGTQHIFKKVGTFYPPNGGGSSWEDYYRLDRIRDRNGNEIVCEYSSGFGYPAGSMLVSAIYEAAHPERRLAFLYQDYTIATNQNGYDWGVRLSTATDPLGNAIEYDYQEYTFPDASLPTHSRKRWLLSQVSYPLVENGDTGQQSSPTQHYTYEVRVTNGPTVNGQTPPFDRILHAGIEEAWQNGDLTAKTRFTYVAPGQEESFPVAIHPLLDGAGQVVVTNVETQKVLTLQSAHPADLQVTYFSTIDRGVTCDPAPCPAALFHVRTRVTDPRGKVIEYDWSGVGRKLDESIDPIDPATGKLLYFNFFGFVTVIEALERFTKDNPLQSDEEAFAKVRFEYTNDLFGDLLEVVDMSGNHIKYTYDGFASQKTQQPTKKEVFKGTPILTTHYEYGVFNKLALVSDAEAKVTRFTFDAKGNRTAIINESLALGNRASVFSYEPPPPPPGGTVEPADGFVFSITDAEGRLTTYSRQFNPADLTQYYGVTAIVDPGGIEIKSVKTYDVLGNLVKEIAPEGFAAGHLPEDYATSYEYDALRRRTRATKPAVLCVGQAAPTVEESFYDLRGNLVKTKAARLPNGQDVVSTSYEYDALNRLIRTTVVPDAGDPTQDIITQKFYNEMGLLWKEIDARGHEVKLYYDLLLRPALREQTVALGGAPQLLQEWYQYEVELAGQTVRPNSGSGAFAYNVGWKPIRVTNARGFVTDSTYDEFYRLVQVVRRRAASAQDPLPIDPSVPGRHETSVGGNVFHAEPQESFAYDGVGNVLEREVVLSNSDGFERQSTYTFYDDFHRPTVVVLDLDPDGANGAAYDPSLLRINDWSDFTPIQGAEDIVTKTKYDRSDKVIEVSDPEDRVSSKFYDDAGRLELEVGPFVGPAPLVRPAVTTSYDQNGAVVEQRGPYPYGGAPSGRLTRHYYDKQGRLEKTIVDLDGDGVPEDATDITSRISYDLVGNPRQEIDPNGNTTSYEYDGANRKTTVLGPPVEDAEAGGTLTSPQTRFEYDPNSNRTAVIDPRGVRTEYDYDEINRVIAERAAAGTSAELEVETSYDPNGNVVHLLARNGIGALEEPQVTSYVYDAFDRLEQAIYPGTPVQTTTSRYYRDGKLFSSQDPKGQVVAYQYDWARRLTRSDHKRANGTTEETRFFEYDRAGNVIQATDGPGATFYLYDALDRVVEEERQTINQATTVVLSEYNLEGQRTKVTYPGTSREVTYEYDPAGRLSSVVDGSSTSSYQYDKSGNVLRQRWPTASDTSYVSQTLNTFDALHRLKTRSTSRRADGATLYSASFGYDLSGSIRALSESVNGQARAIAYSYDAQYRLVSESWSSTGYLYSYDRIGNRLTKVVTGGSTFPSSSYDYNERNELLSEVYDPGNGGAQTTTSYAYDANGNLTAKQVVGGTQTTYAWDVSNRLISVTVGGGVVFQASYDYRTRRLLKTESGSTTYFVYDGGLSIQERPSGQGTPSAEFVYGGGLGAGIGGILYEDRSGTRSHYGYNQVGHTVLTLSASASVTSWRQYEAFGNSAGGSSGTPTNRLANTREKDAASGLYNHGFRYYDPLTGRYVSRDPIGYGDGMNLYQYVGGNPVNGFDPVGLRRDRVWYENLWIWAKTGMWDPADNIVEHVDRYISRDANLAGKIGVVLAQGAVETANFAGDLAFVVDEAARSGGRADAELVSQVVASGLAAEQAQQVASGEWSMWEGTKDASMMNPVSQTIKGGLEIGAGIRTGDTDRIAEGIVSVVSSTYGTSKATHSKPIRLQVPDESLTPVTMGKGTLTVEMAPKGGGKVGGKITGYTDHGLKQAIGRDGGRGVHPEAILDAVRNPTKVVEQAGGTTKYIGEQGTVILNSEGKVVTTWGRPRNLVPNQ
jgi:RHS repeat-associated protein